MVIILQKENKNAAKNFRFAFPSLSKEGLTNFVTRIGQELYCSCEAKLYEPKGYSPG